MVLGQQLGITAIIGHAARAASKYLVAADSSGVSFRSSATSAPINTTRNLRTASESDLAAVEKDIDRGQEIWTGR